jgi:hypothetical protein
MRVCKFPVSFGVWDKCATASLKNKKWLLIRTEKKNEKKRQEEEQQQQKQQTQPQPQPQPQVQPQPQPQPQVQVQVQVQQPTAAHQQTPVPSATATAPAVTLVSKVPAYGLRAMMRLSDSEAQQAQDALVLQLAEDDDRYENLKDTVGGLATLIEREQDRECDQIKRRIKRKQQYETLLGTVNFYRKNIERMLKQQKTSGS